MKTIKLIIAAVLVMAGMSVMGQDTEFFHDGTNLYYDGGYVGIGTSIPTYALDVRINMTEPKFSITNAGGPGGAAFRMYDQASDTDWRFKAAGTGTFKIRDNTNRKDILTLEKNSAVNSIYVKAGGFVGINTATPQATLDVNGNILAASIFSTEKITTNEVEVKMDVWPDYVFSDDYKLKSLDEVESFILENKHLPGVPSQEAIINNGLSLGEMNKILMEKVEELTLYMIELQKQVDELK